jgi:hypothetical protein
VIVGLEEASGAELRLGLRELTEASVISRLEHHRLAGPERMRDEAARRRERVRAIAEELERTREAALANFSHACDQASR